jgi:hypothetical protein
MGDHVREGGHFADVCVLFLGVLTKLRKATISFVILSICPSTWNNSAPTGRIFIKFGILVFFENLLRALKFN